MRTAVKTCRDCGVELPLEAFPTNGWHPSGLRAYRPVCRDCRRVEKRVEYTANPQCEERRAKRAADVERARAKAVAYYQRTKDDEDKRRRRYAAQRRWRQRHPEKVRAKSLRDAKRRYLNRDPAGNIYAEQVLAYDVCAYCGHPSDCRDHIVPLEHGGGSEPDNLTAACTSCNSAKRHRSLLGFLLYRLDATTPEIFLCERPGLPAEVPPCHDDLLGLRGAAGGLHLAA